MTLTKNIGNQFRKRHIDKRIRYPETNQFVVKEIGDRKASQFIKSALQWSVFQQKKELQQESIGKGDTIIYTLNKVYSPVFQISARTRGGFNETYTYDDILKMVAEDLTDRGDKVSEAVDEKSDNYRQLTIEDFLDNYE